MGKSAVIEICSMYGENILRDAGDKPQHPRVLLLAHTGKAASLIGKINFPYHTFQNSKANISRWYHNPWSI